MKLKVMSLLAVALLASVSSLSADIMDVDVTRVAPQYRQAFLNAERFWETRIVGYSPQLSRSVQSQLTKLRITAITAPIDGAGGVLGQAGPNNVLRFGGVSNPYLPGGGSQIGAIARTATMTFDTADIAGLAATPAGSTGLTALDFVVRHEMAHAMGLGSLWADNRLLSAAGGNGQTNYVGKYGLAAYRKESGNTFSRFVPIEQEGGAGTALSHWEDDDPFFNQRGSRGRAELMLGSTIPGENIFVSETTWASFADLWYKVRGVNDGWSDSGSGGGRSPWINNSGPPIFGRFTGGPLAQFSAVPEPSSAGLVLVGVGFLMVRRRKG